MKRQIALLFAFLLLWTVGVSAIMVVLFDRELDATNLGAIILVGSNSRFRNGSRRTHI
jgi:hypothetical protein